MTAEDKALHKGLMQLLNDGTFQLKAREVSSFLKIYNWASQLANVDPKAGLDPSKVKPIKKKTTKKATK